MRELPKCESNLVTGESNLEGLIIVHKVDDFCFVFWQLEVEKWSGRKHFLEVSTVTRGKCLLSQAYDTRKKKKCVRALNLLLGLAAGVT